jgi:O-antigen/teichoic acid export membrane protein
MSEISSDNPFEWLAMTLTTIGTFGVLCLIIYLLNRRKGKFKLGDIWRIMSDCYWPLSAFGISIIGNSLGIIGMVIVCVVSVGRVSVWRKQKRYGSELPLCN